MAVLALVMVGLLSFFTMNNKLAKAQINVSEMQQSLRAAQSGMVRNLRMAGRGGLPVAVDTGDPNTARLLPRGAAVAVHDDATNVKLGDNNLAKVLDGTDILSIRGVFNTPLYQIAPAQDGSIAGTPKGEITVQSRSPTGVKQDLTPLTDLMGKNRPEALILVSAGSDQVYGVVQLDSVAKIGDAVELSFSQNTDYDTLSPGGSFPPNLTAVAAVGILEEYRYYIRDTEPAARLARARFYPGTEDAYAGDTSNLHVDVADGILDLQLALGVDRTGTAGTIEDGETDDSLTADADDWLFNDEGDDETPATWQNQPLFFVRINTLARTGTVDPKHVAQPIDAIENRIYNEPVHPTTDDERLERSYRRRLLVTVVDLRNL